MLGRRCIESQGTSIRFETPRVAAWTIDLAVLIAPDTRCSLLESGSVVVGHDQIKLFHRWTRVRLEGGSTVSRYPRSRGSRDRNRRYERQYQR